MVKRQKSRILGRYLDESESESHSVVSDSLQPNELCSPWNSPGQNTVVGSCSLLQWIFPTQGSNLGLLHCRWILYLLSHQGSPRKLEWVACPFSSGSSWSRNQTRASCIAGGLFTSWATREAQTVVKRGWNCKNILKLLKNRKKAPPSKIVPQKDKHGQS